MTPLMTSSSDQEPASRLPRPGETFANRYEILAELGAGGMSVVFQARDRLTGETLALKVIQPDVAEKPKLIEKFKQELLLARRMAHPNVVRIHDLGDAGPLFYISMEFIEGQTVAGRIARSGPFPLDDFWPVFQQFCEALRYIHSRQVVHRDIKPLNLMIDRTGAVKLMDFGISRDLSSDRTVGVLMGTPAYMAPEVMAGQPATPRSDLYSAGVLLYEMLTGRKPLPGRAESLAAPVPAALDRAIRRCLELDPARRPASVDELLALASGSAARAPEPERTFASLTGEEPAELSHVMPHFLGLLEWLGAHRNTRMLAAPLTPGSIRIRGGQVEVEMLAADGSTDGAEMGEPKYTAPEALHDGPVKVEIADIYVVGFLLYECLLGRRRFEDEFGAVLREGGDLAWLRWHGDFGRRARPLEEVVPVWPRQLSATLARMMCKVPAERLQTYEEALAELQRIWQPGTVLLEPDEHKPPAPPAPVIRPARRPTPWIWMIVSAALAVMAGIGLWWWQSQRRTSTGGGTVKQTIHLPPPPPEEILTPSGIMRLVPAGPFLMGAEQGRLEVAGGLPLETEAPPRTVEVPAFYLDQLEVSNAGYLKFCAATGRARPKSTITSDYLDQPALPAMASWTDADAFCAWAGKRLPTEEEWEKAARGTDGRLFPWGNEPDAQRAAWRENSPNRMPRPVGSFPGDRSPYGVLDLSGNVPEWVADDFHLYPGNAGLLPESEILGKKVVRGGGFYLPGLLDEARVKSGYGRVTVRNYNPPEGKPGQPPPIGFRCAAEIEGATKIQLKR